MNDLSPLKLLPENSGEEKMQSLLFQIKTYLTSNGFHEILTVDGWLTENGRINELMLYHLTDNPEINFIIPIGSDVKTFNSFDSALNTFRLTMSNIERQMRKEFPTPELENVVASLDATTQNYVRKIYAILSVDSSRLELVSYGSQKYFLSKIIKMNKPGMRNKVAKLAAYGLDVDSILHGMYHKVPDNEDELKVFVEEIKTTPIEWFIAAHPMDAG